MPENDLVSHLEQHLGPIREGWKPAGTDVTIQAVQFADRPEPGVSTYTTLGLSRSALPMKDGRLVRQELLLSAYREYPAPEIASFMTSFADYVRTKERALLRGDVVGPYKPLINQVNASAVYCSMPVFFPSEFATYGGSTPSTVIVWLIPLVGREAEFVRRNGWERFEELLEADETVDLWSLDRTPLRSVPL